MWGTKVVMVSADATEENVEINLNAGPTLLAAIDSLICIPSYSNKYSHVDHSPDHVTRN